MRVFFYCSLYKLCANSGLKSKCATGLLAGGGEVRDLSSQFQNDLELTQYSILFGTGNVSGRNVELTTRLQLLPINGFSNYGAVNMFITASGPSLAQDVRSVIK